MMGFQGHQQNQLATYHESPVALHDCETSPPVTRVGGFDEVNNRIESSLRKFDVDIKNITQNEITLDRLATKNNFDRISGIAKVT